MTFLQFQKELYYISEGIILKNSQKDIRRCEGFQKVLYSALIWGLNKLACISDSAKEKLSMKLGMKLSKHHKQVV